MAMAVITVGVFPNFHSVTVSFTIPVVMLQHFDHCHCKFHVYWGITKFPMTVSFSNGNCHRLESSLPFWTLVIHSDVICKMFCDTVVQRCEKQLDVFSITLMRQQAEIAVRFR